MANDLKITFTWPPNINAITAKFLKYVHSQKFDLAKIIACFATHVDYERKHKNYQPCHLIMYAHMVHSMLHWAGVPNKLGQANELKYFTGNAIYHTDTYTNNL